MKNKTKLIICFLLVGILFSGFFIYRHLHYHERTYIQYYNNGKKASETHYRNDSLIQEDHWGSSGRMESTHLLRIHLKGFSDGEIFTEFDSAGHIFLKAYFIGGIGGNFDSTINFINNKKSLAYTTYRWSPDSIKKITIGWYANTNMQLYQEEFSTGKDLTDSLKTSFECRWDSLGNRHYIGETFYSLEKQGSSYSMSERVIDSSYYIFFYTNGKMHHFYYHNREAEPSVSYSWDSLGNVKQEEHGRYLNPKELKKLTNYADSNLNARLNQLLFYEVSKK